MGPYPPTTTDLTGVLASTGAASADMVIPAVAAPDCVNIEKALTQQGITDPKKIVAAPLCLNGQVAAGLGGDFPKWTYLIASSLFGDTTDPGMIEYMKLAQTYSTPANAPDPWNIVDFGQMMTDRQDPQPGRLRQPDPGRDPVGREGVQGPAGPRRPGAGVRLQLERARRLQQPLAVLRVRRP